MKCPDRLGLMYIHCTYLLFAMGVIYLVIDGDGDGDGDPTSSAFSETKVALEVGVVSSWRDEPMNWVWNAREDFSYERG